MVMINLNPLKYITLKYKVLAFMLGFVCLVCSSEVDASSEKGIPKQGVLEFNILRNGDVFGKHILEFNVQDQKVTTNISIEMKVQLAFITLFKYEHRNTEIIQGTQLISIDSFTNDDGDDWYVKAKLDGDRISVDRTRENYDAPINIASGTYWNKAMLAFDKVLNTQKGMLSEIKVEKQGVEQVRVADEFVLAERYKITLPNRQIDIWYHTETGQWVDLRFEIRGSKIDYERLTPISSVKSLSDKIKNG